jgi:hypothetical protein
MLLSNYISSLDTQRFGFNIAKVNKFNEEPRLILDFLKKEQVQLIISKIPVGDYELINKLEQLGFELKDIQVTYQYDLQKQLSELKLPEGITIEGATSDDIPELENMARTSFYNYGHYARNPKLNKETCADIYADWIKNSCLQKSFADIVYVAKVNNTVAGFLSFKIFHHEEKKYAAGGIGAMNPGFRKQGIFRLISLQGLHWAKAQQLDWVEHNVLIDNFPVNKSFQGTGFSISKSFITLHHWINK